MLIEDLPKPNYPKTSFLIVRLRTVFNEGLYGEGKFRRQPKIDILTKIWCYKRLSDLMYCQLAAMPFRVQPRARDLLGWFRGLTQTDVSEWSLVS